MRVCFLTLILSFCGWVGFSATPKQQALDEWRLITAPGSPSPRVFVKGDSIRFYFTSGAELIEFRANWDRVRISTADYEVNSALLHWNQRLPKIPEGSRSWREATVIAGPEWRRISSRLVAALTPAERGAAAYYQAFLADAVLYRDAQGVARSVPLGMEPKGIVIQKRYSIEESLEHMARVLEDELAQSYPWATLFVLIAPDTSRFAHPFLIDRQKRECVFLAPAALYDTSERGPGISATAQGIREFIFESHGVALIKNPVSSAARLADVGIQTANRFLRLPLPRSIKGIQPVSNAPGMDLGAWEKWLDTYTGTRREEGALRLLIDGDRFFGRLEQAMDGTTNHLHCKVYIFDRDDVGVAMADRLMELSEFCEVKVLFDRMGSMTAGLSPPSTPLPEDFVPPTSILSYLRTEPGLEVRTSLNPWLMGDHGKLILVDSRLAWLGGMNLGREYRFEWHDMMVEVAGPVVHSFEKEFRRDWAHSGWGGDLAYLGALVSEPSQPKPTMPPQDWIKVRRLPTKTLWKPFKNAVLGALRHSRNHIYLENPYLFDRQIIRELVQARKRGVDVRVVLPRVNDLKAGGRSNFVIANYLLEHKVRVFFYPGMTHVKALLVDGWSCVGSGNLNHLSLGLNQEQNIATSDPGFSHSLRSDLFEQDFARSYEMRAPISVGWVDFLADLILQGF